MTDVPFVSAMNTAILFYVRWVKRGRTGDLSLGSVAALLACLIRQPGAALALIPLLYLLLDRMAGGERRALPWSQGVWLLVPFLGVGLTFWWIHAVHGETRVALEKAQMLRLIFAIDRWVWVYVRELLHALMHLGLVLWPLAWMAFGRLSTRALAGASAVVAVLSGLVLWQEGALPNPLGVMLTWDELGHSRVLIAGEIAHRQLPRWGQAVMLGVSLSGAVGLVAVLWDRLRRWPPRSREPDTVLLLNLFLQGLLFEALWLYYDRYYLPLLPGCMALLLMALATHEGGDHGRDGRGAALGGDRGHGHDRSVALSSDRRGGPRLAAPARGRRRAHRCGVCPDRLVALCPYPIRAAQPRAGARCAVGHRLAPSALQDCECR